MKRLVVCCDGTWNRPDHLDQGVAAPTNVAKLALAVAATDGQGNEQKLYYQAGVGTRPAERWLGGGFGVGLSRNVKDCYRFVAEYYERGDELYLFGFSRGAYTARSTVGMIRNCGILLPEHLRRVDEAFRLYRDRSRATAPGELAAQLFRRTYSHPNAPIQFIGVWDTVGALGIPIDGFRPPGLSRLWSFHDPQLSRLVRHAFHAVAIDERRQPFKPTLWVQHADAGDQEVEQMLFAGVHCDVGGGYADPSLSEIPLLWIAGKAVACGLALSDDRLVRNDAAGLSDARRQGIEVAPDPLGCLNDSRTRFYRLFPTWDRLTKPETREGSGMALSDTVRARRQALAQYRPPGLDDWL